MLSIDQNCLPLWDTVPKLHALARHGRQVTQVIENIDVAFTSMGAAEGSPLRLARERFYRSGGADWGAALFYHEFLGRQPVEIRQWEPLTGLKTNVLARQLGRDIDDLYAQYSPSDNYQLIGPSYVGDREHHRVIGDLKIDEVALFIDQLYDRLSRDVQARMPRRHADFDQWLQVHVENLPFEKMASATLTDAYWLELDEHPARWGLADADAIFHTHSDGVGLLEVFTRHYDQAGPLYNQAIAETGVGLSPLDLEAGELPFFAVMHLDGRQVRTGVRLDGGSIVIGERRYDLLTGGRMPVDALDGIQALAGKAVLLTIQARFGREGQPLAMPYKGSAYVPASHRLEQLLRQAGLLTEPVCPIIRVRFRLLDRLRELDTPIALPDYLSAAMGQQIVPAPKLGESWADLMAEAARRLDAFGDDAGRQRWLTDNCGQVAVEVEAIEHRRRELAAADPKDPALREMGKRQKQLQQGMLSRLVEQIDRDWQVSQLDYWDSRGALWPWSLALGGQAFYDRLLAMAEIYEETAGRGEGILPS